MGYKAVYPDEVIQAHLARRRALRPGEEYRAPTEAAYSPSSPILRAATVAMNEVASYKIRSGVSPGCAGGSGRSSVISCLPL